MRIVAISDMHGDLLNVFKALDLFRPDLLLCCGDWGDPEQLSPDAFNDVLAKSLVLSVYGNHDDVGLLSHARNCDGSPVLLSPGEVCELDGLRFAGISGIWAKSHRKPYYVTDEEVAEYASKLAGKGVDVLLSHGCPIGLADTLPGGRHGGQRCFLDAYHVIRPRVYLCGHLHAAQKRILKDGRVVVNIGYTCEGDYWTFHIEQKNVEFEYHRLWVSHRSCTCPVPLD